MALSVTALAACGDNRDPKEVATAYFEDAKEGNAKDFGELFTPEAKKIVGFIGGNAELMKSINEDLKSYKIRKVEEKNEIATVTVDAVYKKDSKNDYKKVIVIELEKTEEGWKISKS
ncbi:lumazine-binding protein [Bacillus thuringiensis]|uniref:lumazine-binding protein n=1 Tax=Bacillus cereus group TaxID=86661 RepID=UPI003BF9CB9F